MESTNRGETQRALDDLGAAVQEGEEALKSITGDKSGQIRAKLQATVDKAKAMYSNLEDKTVACAKATDKSVREHPYQAIGIAFGVGMLFGILVMRGSRDRE
jgi:ElaB/YqjD/DUF883 family membrane-anchored ribosome-binding protein